MCAVGGNQMKLFKNLSRTVDYNYRKFYQNRPTNQRAIGWQSVKENRGPPCTLKKGNPLLLWCRFFQRNDSSCWSTSRCPIN